MDRVCGLTTVVVVDENRMTGHVRPGRVPANDNFGRVHLLMQFKHVLGEFQIDRDLVLRLIVGHTKAVGHFDASFLVTSSITYTTNCSSVAATTTKDDVRRQEAPPYSIQPAQR
ncbi:hypothetical protein V5799_003509 [Amblyomma americanum]|uniref:Uncharacterized protein n=1 Tax=Amblyomma americanum TaxID=6943 RepID=A0AAQ4D8S0_AMBAM